MVQVHLCIHATINQSININSPVFTKALWRNGSASDSRSEGCVFNSRRGHTFKFALYKNIKGTITLQ